MDYGKYLNEKKIKFVENIPEDLKCIFCKEILVDPQLAHCGHSFCKECLIDYVNNEENKYCVGNESACKEEILQLNENIVKNVVAFNKIKNLQVHCNMDNCNEMIKFKDLEIHVGNCGFKLVSCPYKVVGCIEDDMSEIKLKKHCESCSIEHARLSMERSEELETKNEKLNEEINEMKEKEEEYENQVENLKLELENKQNQISGLELKVENILQKLNENDGKIDKLKVDFQNELIQQKDDLQNELRQQKIDFQNEVIQQNNEFKTELNQLKDALKNVSQQVNKNNIEANKMKYDFKSQNDHNQVNMIEMNLKLKKLEDENISLKNQVTIQFDSLNHARSSYDWIIENYSNKLEEARKNNDVYFESPPFFLTGYCIVLLFFPCRKFGNLIDNLERMSVKFKIIKNKFDNQVMWPCKTKFKFSIIRRHDYSDFTADNYLKFHHVTNNESEDVWERPDDNPRVSSQYFILCRCNHINNTFYNLLMNNSILIRCSVCE